MANLAADRDAPMKATGRSIDLGVAAATEIFKGAMVAVNAAGFAVPADDTASITVVGVADEHVDNTGAAGDLTVRVFKGVVAMLGGVAPPTQAEIGIAVHMEFDQTVQLAASSANNIVAGTLDSIVGPLFYVNIFDQA